MLEAIMAGNVVAIAIVALVAGVVVGVLLAVSLVIRRDDRSYAMTGHAPGWLDTGVRRLTGVGRRAASRDLIARHDHRL
jgi:hypothetical protein